MKNLILAVALLAGPTLAQDQAERFDPASIMPAETILFAQADGGAVIENLAKLDLVRVLFAEQFKSFLGPLRENIPEGVDGFTEPIAQWIQGQAAIGVSGMVVRLRNFDGSWDRVRVAQGSPIDGALVHKMIRSGWWVPGGGPTILWDLEAVAVIEPGPALRDALNNFLEKPPVQFTQKIVQRGARQILTLKFSPFEENDVWMAPEIHADLGGDRWILATSDELLSKAIASERRASLAQDAQFDAARKRHTSGAPALFVYGDARRFLEVAQPLLPPFATDMLDAEGSASIRTLSIGVSLVEGGIRESWGVGLDENPKGFWRLFDAMPPGLKAIEKAPPRTVGIVALKFDLQLFLKRFDEVVGALFPGTEKVIRGDWTQDLLAEGIHLDTDLAAALGDETALIVLPPGGVGVPIPSLAFAMQLRDEAAFARLMNSLRALASRPPVMLKDKQLREGVSGWQLSWPVPTGMPEFQVHEGHLIGSTNPAETRRLLANWANPPQSLAKDGEIFRKVMQGLNGGDTDSLVALIYGDLRAYLPPLLAFGAGTGLLPPELFKTNPMPDLRKLGDEFSGLAIALRRDKHGIALESFGPTGGIFGVVPFLWVSGEAQVGVAQGIPIR